MSECLACNKGAVTYLINEQAMDSEMPPVAAPCTLPDSTMFSSTGKKGVKLALV